jgi:hypothetical protein
VVMFLGIGPNVVAFILGISPEAVVWFWGISSKVVTFLGIGLNPYISNLQSTIPALRYCAGEYEG